MTVRVTWQVMEPADQLGLYGQDPANNLQDEKLAKYWIATGDSGQGAVPWVLLCLQNPPRAVQYCTGGMPCSVFVFEMHVGTDGSNVVLPVSTCIHMA